MNRAPFQKIIEASKTTGLSQSFLRKGCKAGSVPHIVSGNVYYIDVERLLERLRTSPEAFSAVQGGK